MSAPRPWIVRQRWLLLRRASQLAILLLFLTGPWFGVWILKGNLSASLIFDTVPLTDPLLALQTMVAGHCPYTTALTGALMGRARCTCPLRCSPRISAAGISQKRSRWAAPSLRLSR